MLGVFVVLEDVSALGLDVVVLDMVWVHVMLEMFVVEVCVVVDVATAVFIELLAVTVNSEDTVVLNAFAVDEHVRLRFPTYVPL